MPRLHTKQFEDTGIVRTFPNGYASVVRLDETVVGYGVYQPGAVANDVMGDAEGSGVPLADAGEHELKGMPGARRVFRVAD